MEADRAAIEGVLRRSLEDQHLSRGERRELSRLIEGLDPETRRTQVSTLAFEVARGRLSGESSAPILDWLEDVVQALHRVAPGPAGPEDFAEAWFSPGDDCAHRIAQLVAHARRSVDIAVFTITDDRISEAILRAHRKGVELRIATDDEKAGDLGSDIPRLREAGVPVRVDRSEFHMHHKFALFDAEVLLTGSYNWTRGAARDNEENFIVTGDPRLVAAFARTFERLWKRLN